jgi:multidrug efflux pump
MQGIVGRLFREFALTISMAILISLVVSLTLTPMMCAKFLTATVALKDSMLKKFYARSLKIALKHHRIMLVLTILTFISTIYLFIIVPKGFFPQQDTGRIIGHIEGDQDISFTLMDEKLKILSDIISQDQAVKNVVAFTSGGNTGMIYIILKDLHVRKINIDQVIARLRTKTNNIAGFNFYMQAAQDLLIGARSGNAQFQYTISANSIEEVNKAATLIMNKLSEIKEIADVNSDQKDKGLQSYVKIDYDKAANFGISNKDIVEALYNAFGQNIAHIIYDKTNQYSVVLELEDAFLKHPDALNNIYVKSAKNSIIPLANIASFTNLAYLTQINHQELSPAVTLYFNLLPNIALGDVVTKINNKVSELNLPTNIQAGFKGTAAAFKSGLAGELFLIIAALLAVYITLGMLYESLVHPFTIISSLPSAALGAILALLITKTALNVIAIIGIILLIGIVKKNAIMMIDFVLEIKKSKQNIVEKEAIYEASLLRFRPIMMTTFCALLGAIPLAFDNGVGGEIRKPLGITIIGGLIVSQILTLYTTPVVYLYMQRFNDGRKNV